MDKINMSLRFKNKATLTALIGLLLVLIKQIGDMFGIDLSQQTEQISGIFGTILTILGLLGVIVDPTTKGISDTGIVKTYQEPRDSNNPDEMIQWQKQNNVPEIKQLQPKEFDTSQPFSDNSDEIGFDVNQYEKEGVNNDSINH